MKIEGVNISTAVSLDKIKQNIVDARDFNLSPINYLSDWREGRPIALVGGGPSLSTQLDKLTEYIDERIMVCGSAHDYLLDNNIIPTYCLVCDPDPIMAKYLTKWHEDCIYLIASQCDKEVFKLLTEGNGYVIPRCYTWNCGSGEKLDKELFDNVEINIPGGCTVGTRAILTAIGMGFKNIHLFGYDSCIQEDKHHAYDFVEPLKESLGPIEEITLDDPDSTKFKVAGYMLAQIFDFQEILKRYAGTLNIQVFGDGVLAKILEIGEAKAKILRG